MTSSRRSAAAGRILRTVLGHPLLMVAALAILVGVVNLAWTARNRQPGGFDVDEVTHLSHAFRWQRTIDPRNPFAVYSGVLGQEKGPLTMLVSVVALVLGPNTVTAALAASAMLHGLSAVAVAGIAKRLAGALAALVAGVIALALPAAVVAARSYQLAPAVGATLALAVWSLLASERGWRLVPMLAFGVSVGLLLLSRTMVVSFLPGLVIAGVLHLDRTRAALRNAALSVAIAVVIAMPWWVAQREFISEYLVGHGYGRAAEGFGPVGLGDRALQRWFITRDAVGPLLVGLAAVVIVAYGAQGARHLSRSTAVDAARSEVAVVWIPAIVGFAFLMSTANLGMYFELPLLILAVPGVVVLAARLPAPVPRWVGRFSVVVAVLTVVVSVTDTGGRRDDSGFRALLQRTLFPGLANYQYATMEVEPRLASPDRSVRRDAMQEWWAASQQVVQDVAASVVDAEPALLTTCGSGPQVSSGTFSLASELDQVLRDSWWEWLSTSAPSDEMQLRMQPRSDGTPRVVVLIHSPSLRFTGEEHVERCSEVADRLGWRTASTVGLPDGGTVEVMVHPDAG